MAKKKNIPRKISNTNISAKPKANKNKQIVKEVDEPKINKLIASILNKWGLLFFLLITVPLLTYIFRDFLWHKYVYLFKDIGSDTLNIYYPNWIHHGENTSRWSFYEGMGRAMTGYRTDFNIMMGKLWRWFQYPFTYISQFNGWNKLPHRIIFGEVKNFILIGFFFYLYLRTISIKGYSALVGALLFTFSGYMVLGSSWYHTRFAIVFIFMIFSFEQFYKKNNWIFLPFAFYLLRDHLYYLYGLFLMFYSAYRFIDDNGIDVKKFAIFWLKIAGLGIIGIGLSADTTISSIHNILNTPRGSGQTGYVNKLSEFPIFGLLDPIHYASAILRTLGTDLLGNGSFFRGWRNYLEDPVFYCGLVSLLLVPQVFIHLNKRRKIVFAAFLSIWVLMVIFPFFRYAYYKFVGDYYKQGFDLFIPLILVLYAMYALNFFLTTKKKINLILLFSTLFVLLVALYYPYFSGTQNYVEKYLQSAIRNLLMLYSVVLVGFNYKKIRVWAQLAMLVLLVFELGYFSFRTVNNRQAVTTVEMDSRIGYNDYTKEAIQYLKKKDPNFYRLEKDYSSGIAVHRSLNDAKVQNFYGTANYSSFNQLNYVRFLQKAKIIKDNDEIATRWAPGFKQRPLLLNMASVKYILTKNEKSDYQRFGFYPVYDSLGVRALENRFFLPLGFTYDKYMSQSAFEQAPNTTMMDVSLLKACVLDQNAEYYQGYASKLQALRLDEISANYTWQDLDKDILERKADTLNITTFRHHYIKGTIKSDRPKLLFLSIPYDPGWIARVNGEEVSVQMVNIGFSGIVIEQGEHEVEFEYIPIGADVSRTLTGISFFLYIALVLGFIYSRKAVLIGLYEKIIKKK